MEKPLTHADKVGGFRTGTPPWQAAWHGRLVAVLRPLRKSPRPPAARHRRLPAARLWPHGSPPKSHAAPPRGGRSRLRPEPEWRLPARTPRVPPCSSRPARGGLKAGPLRGRLGARGPRGWLPSTSPRGAPLRSKCQTRRCSSQQTRTERGSRVLGISLLRMLVHSSWRVCRAVRGGARAAAQRPTAAPHLQTPSQPRWRQTRRSSPPRSQPPPGGC